LREGARFCDGCGAPLAGRDAHAEYKQVTVLFADLVHSMDIASAVGAERLREIITNLANRCAVVITRYNGTLDKFTGNGIMATFGAPVAQEDHALRACLAALAIQDASLPLAAEVRRRDGVELRLRIGLNSGRVVAGEIGSLAGVYTPVGHAVGMAQRMESVAPPGGVMVSESTAHLVQGRAALSDPQLVHIKGFEDPVTAQLLLDVRREAPDMPLEQSTLVGRSRELAALTGELERAIGGRGRVVDIVGSPGIGKSRLVAEMARIANERGVEVISAACESHDTDVPLGVAVRLLRETFGVAGTEPGVARTKLRALFADSDADDVLLLDDLLGIRDIAEPMPDIAPQAGKRRVDRLINTVLLERKSPALYIIEDVHWIDAASDAVLAELICVLSQTPSLVLITHRPQLPGALLRTAKSTTIVPAPLTDIDTAALVGELLGPDATTAGLVSQICEHADGNPFFAEEIVRDLAARGVLTGSRGSFACPAHPAQVTVPATLEAAITARIDRLDSTVKRALNTAAVAGTSFDAALIAHAIGCDADASLAALVEAELIGHTGHAPHVQYAFRHPLIRTVAYQSQLKSVRTEQHRRLAVAIQQREAQALDQSAAVIAGHLEVAGDLREAYLWHMRAATWLSQRNIRAARTSWQHARDIADSLPTTDGDRAAMQTTTRIMLCATAWRVGIATADTGFDELQQLCGASGDALSQTITTALLVSARHRDGDVAGAFLLAKEVVAWADSFGDDDTAIRLMANVTVVILSVGETNEVLRIAQRIIDLADGDPAKGHLPHSSIGSPLALATMTRGAARAAFGTDGWKDDLQRAVTMARGFDLTSRAMVTSFVHLVTTLQGWLTPDASAADESEEILRLAEQRGDDLTLAAACMLRGAVLRHRTDSDATAGLQMLARARELAANVGVRAWNPPIDIETAKAKVDAGELDEAIAMLRGLVDDLKNGELGWYGVATTALVQALLARGRDNDAQAAETAIDRLDQVPIDAGVVAHELIGLRLRALLAQARGNDVRYVQYRDRYRDEARTLGFEGHIAWAEAMP
jgi:class 3 adenylate cyclase